MAEDNKLSKREALYELHKSVTKQIEDFEKKCVELRKKELAHAEKQKLKKNFPGVGGQGDMASPPMAGSMQMSEGVACKLCGEKLCKCDTLEKFAKNELKKFEHGQVLSAQPAPQLAKPVSHPDSFALKPAPQLAGPAAHPAKVQTMVERVASKMPGGPKLPGSHLFGKAEPDMAKAGFKPGSPAPASMGSAGGTGMPPKPTVKLASLGSVKAPAPGGAAKPPKAPALGAGQPNLKSENSIGKSEKGKCENCGKPLSPDASFCDTSCQNQAFNNKHYTPKKTDKPSEKKGK